MSHVLHLILVPIDGDGKDAGELAEELVPDTGVNYDWRIAGAAIRPDGMIVNLADRAGVPYADYKYDRILADLRRTIAEHSALPLPVLDESSSPQDLRLAAGDLLRRASAREALGVCGSPDLFDPFAHEVNAWQWGQFGVTHFDTDDDDPDQWLVLMDFHS